MTPLGKYDVHTRSGDIEIAIPEKAKLEMNATTDRGEISNEFGGGFHNESSGRGSTLRGSNGDGARVVLNTNRGTITVRKSSGPEQSTVVPPVAPKAPAAPNTLKPLAQ